MTDGLMPAELPADAVEVGRVLGAWGIQGWFKVQAFSASPEALFHASRWFLLPPERGAKASFDGPVELSLARVREHGDGIVAQAHGIADRDVCDGLRGARIFIPRGSFPVLPEGEYYWVDLIGLRVVNRQGVELGTVVNLLATGPQQVLVLRGEQEGRPVERLIPFVDAYVDDVERADGRITVDWQPDY